VPWTIDLTLVWLSAISRNRSSGYVKDNDVRYGLKVAHRNPKSSEVTNLQCHGRSALHLVGRRRLGRSAKLRQLFKDGVIPSITIILRSIFATNILVNGFYTRLLNPLMRALHSSMTFRLCSITHVGVMQAKHILFIKQFQH
jgi:hypothetical protein